MLGNYINELSKISKQTAALCLVVSLSVLVPFRPSRITPLNPPPSPELAHPCDVTQFTAHQPEIKPSKLSGIQDDDIIKG